MEMKLSDCDRIKSQDKITENADNFDGVSIQINEEYSYSLDQFEDFHRHFAFLAENDEIEKFYSKIVCNCDEKSESSFLTTKMCEFDDERERSQTLLKLNISAFKQLFDILNSNQAIEYHHVCLKIIYSFFNEAKDCEFENSVVEKLIDMILTINVFEHKLQLLKVFLVFFQSTSNEDFMKMKDKIEKEIHHDEHDHPAICRTSYQTLTNHCDVHFFRLIFILKENLINSFKSKYKEFIKMYQNYFGEYWIYEIKQNGRLLYFLAEIQGLVDTKEFLLITTKESELKLSIVESFSCVSEFMAVFDRSDRKKYKKLLTSLTEFVEDKLLNYIDKEKNTVFAQVNKFKDLFKNKPKIRKLLFGRKDLQSKSLFEKILSKPELKTHKWDDDFKYVHKYIWNEFQLWEKPELLTLQNPHGKRLIDYVLETENDAYFISFLMIPVTKDYEVIRTPKYFMMLKNSLYFDHTSSLIPQDMNDSTESVYYDANLSDDDGNITSRCLLEYHLRLIDENNRKDYDNNKNLLYLLEEMSQFCPNLMGKDQFFEKICKRIFSEDREEFDGENELKLPRKHFYIGLMMIYWNYCVDTKQDCHSIFRSLSRPEDVIVKGTESIPFFDLLSLILNKRESEFIQNFSSEFDKMEASYKHVYGLAQSYNRHNVDNEDIFNYYEKYSTNFCFILLYAAIKTNQKGVIKQIFEYNNFLICCPEFPANMIPDEIHYYTMKMFLESKYELGRGEFPRKWIPKKIFNEFLDSRITYSNNFYKIDCNFMLPYYNHDIKLDKIDDGVVVNEDSDTLEYILNDYDLAPLVTHPVMEMIIMTKIQKYDRIFFWNLIGFMLFYIIPTTCVVYFLHNCQAPFEDIFQNKTQNSTILDDRNTTDIKSSNSTISDNTADAYLSKSDLGWMIGLNFGRFLFITIRELMQMIYIDDNIKNYFRKISNWLECFLILFSISSLVFCILDILFGLTWIFYFLVGFEAFNVFLMIIVTTFLYPTLKFSIYMKCFQTVFGTYLMIFFLFLPLFVGCAAMAFIVFDKNVGGQIEHFHTFGNATMKYVVMYSGEMDIEINKISGFLQAAAVTMIIILVINKANLILSIVVDDVKKIMDQAKEFSLSLYAEKYVEFAKKIRIFYACEIEYEEPTRINKQLFWFVKFFTRKYPHIHQINTLYVDKKTGFVHINEKRPLFEASVIYPGKLRNSDNFIAKSITENWDRMFSHLKLDDKTMTKIHQIVEKDANINHEN